MLRMTTRPEYGIEEIANGDACLLYDPESGRIDLCVDDTLTALSPALLRELRELVNSPEAMRLEQVQA